MAIPMFRPLIAAFSLSFLLLLTACGSEGSSPAAAGSPASTAGAAVSSSVVKGLIRNGVVRLSRFQSGSYVTVATATTDDAGAYQLTVPSPVAGEVLRLDLDLSTDAGRPTQMLCDAAACGSKTFGEWVTLTSTPGLSSWVSINSSGNAVVMPMTPVSTLLVHYAERVGGGHMDAASLGLARQRVAGLFGISADDLLTRPGNVANGLFLQEASPAAVKLSLLASAFAQLATGGDALEDVIGGYADAFAENNGHLLQAGGDHSLQDVYGAVQQVLNAAGNPELQAAVVGWLNNAIAALEAGKLNPVCHEGNPCAEFSSDRFLTALGTGTDTLGGDLRRVMLEQNAGSLEALLAQELAQFRWLASNDSAAIAGIAVQSVGYAVLGSIGLPPTAGEGLTVTLNNDTHVLHLEGTQNGMAVDLDIALTPLFAAMQGSKVFTFGAVGTLENSNVKASIDGTLTINAVGTDFTPLLMAFIGAGDNPNALAQALSGILKTGKATFTLAGEAGIVKKSNNSTLAIEGEASLTVNMAGGSNGAITASGAVAHGSITLPNNAVFSVTPQQGESLTFALGQDGTFSTKFTAFLLQHSGQVTATGKLAALGTLLTNLRNGVVGQIEAGTGDLMALLDQLLADVSGLRLTLNGQAVIPDFNHTYTLSYADGQMALSQPNSTTAALKLTFSDSGILAQAGSAWWLLGLGEDAQGGPAITMADDTGGEWVFSLSGLLLALQDT